MLFPLNMIVGGLFVLMHMVISFNLKLSDTYKTIFRIYSVVSNMIFLALLGGFYLLSISSFPNFSIGIYFQGFALLYALLTIPLLITVIVLMKRWVIKLDVYSLVTRYIVITTPSLLLIALSIIGYYPFMLLFYGFAP